jgi:hypothetical protein
MHTPLNDNIVVHNFSQKDWWTKGGYRLGDMIMYQTERLKRWPNLPLIDGNKVINPAPDGKEYHCNRFPDSIATEYMQATEASSDFDVLDTIIDRRLSNIEDDTSFNHTNGLADAVIHLRVGDVINWAPFTVQEFLDERRRHYESWAEAYQQSFVRPLSYYDALPFPKEVKRILLYGATRCGGALRHDHKDMLDDSKSVAYVKAVTQLLLSKGFDVRAILNGDPDEDFLAMTGSRYFVPSGGGYSLLISQIVLRRNNKVYLTREGHKDFILFDDIGRDFHELSDITRPES